MKKYKKVLLILSGCLVLAGGIMLTAGAVLGGSPSFVITRNGIRSDKREGNYIEKKEELKNITSMDLKSWSGDIEFVESEKFKIEYGYWEDYTNPQFEIKDGKMTLKLVEDKVYRQTIYGGVYFGGSWGESYKRDYIKVYVPSNIKFEEIKVDSQYNDLHMDIGETKLLTLLSDYSDITLNGIKADITDISNSYGELQAKDCSFQTTDLKMDYGNAKLSDSVIGETQIAAKYGEVFMSSVKAGSLKIGADYGNVNIKDVQSTNDKKEMELLELSVEYGELEMNRVNAEIFSLEAKNGTVSGNEMAFGTGVVQGDYCDLRLRDLTVRDLDVDDGYGEINLELTGEEDDYDLLLKSGYGEINLNGRAIEGTLERQKNRKNSIEIDGNYSDITIYTN